MDTMLIIKTIHIICSTILFGAGIGTAFQMVYGYFISSKKGTDLKTIKSVTKGVVVADWCLTTPTGILQPLTGFILIHMMGYDMDSTWLIWTYILYVFTAFCWFPVVWIQCEMAKIANACEKENIPLPKKFHTFFWIWFSLGWPAFLSLVAVYYLMVAKPF